MSARYPLTPAYSVAVPDRHVVLLFGLRWAPLVGSKPAVLARRRAIAARATHYVHLGRLGMCFGMARLTLHWGGTSHRYHAGAAVFAACQEGGPVAWLTRLPDDRYWLVAARDGTVLSRSDRLYPDIELGRQAMQSLCAEFPGLQEISDEQALASLAAGVPVRTQAGVGACVPGQRAQTSANEVTSREVPIAAVCLLPSIDALSARAQPGDAMIALAWYARVRSLWWVFLLFVMVGAVWHISASAPTPAESESVSIHALAPEDVRARWHAAQVHAMSAHWHGADSFVQVLSHVRGVPVLLAGWQLSVIQCDWVKSVWACHADFDRIDPRATNVGFLHALPGAWTARFAPLGRASAHWAVQASVWDERMSGLPDVDWVDRILVSRLQRRAPAFTHITLGDPDVLVVDDMLKDPLGERIAEPAGMSHPRRRSIRVQGPLRSFGLIRELDPYVAWDSLRLTFTPRADVSLSRSALHLELGGWVHEQISA